MVWHESTDVEQYLAAVGDLLFHDPALHTVSLTICANTRARPDGTRFAWWQEETHEVTGCVSVTPPYPTVLGVVPEHAMVGLVKLWDLTGVNGPTATAAQVAALAARHSGRRAVLHDAERLYRLGTLVAPAVPGAARPATEDDIDLLLAWFGAFVGETGVISNDLAGTVRDRLSYRGFLLWEHEGPKALAGHTRPAFGAVRLGPVYTPPEHRGQGYGAAATAAASQRARELADEVVLFTDLTNPTSNALYQRLGYRPLTDRAVLQLW